MASGTDPRLVRDAAPDTREEELRRGVLHPALNPGGTGLTSAASQTTIWIRGTNYRRTNFAGDAKWTIRDKSTCAISDAPSYYRALSPITIFLHS